MLHIQTVELSAEELALKPVTVVSQPRLEAKLGFEPEKTSGGAPAATGGAERTLPAPFRRIVCIEMQSVRL